MLPKVDFEGFARAVKAMRSEIMASIGKPDLDHLRMVERRGRMCSAAGYATAWIMPNPVSAALIAQGNITRWLLMHHISHRGYDKVPDVPERYTSKAFAMGWRRYVDWFDWIVPEAWALEHNVLHHYNTGDRGDPDLVERNVAYLRKSKAPMWRRYVHVALLASTWKFSYYAPSTLNALQLDRRRKSGETPRNKGFLRLFDPRTKDGRELYLRSILPYGLARFALAPSLFAPFGPFAVASVFINSLMAEIMTNIHAFIVIGPNHTGDDLYRFDDETKDKLEYYARQVLGSVDYATGSEAVDWAQAYLNYQIEHHLWPDIPMLKYRDIQPRTKALAQEHGLPYKQESVFKRVRKLVDVMVGKTSMQRIDKVTAPGAFTPIPRAATGTSG